MRGMGAHGGSAPAVAVVTPVYNGADLIEACIGSVRAQDTPDWIHILVDNASTDGTAEVVSRIAAGDDRVKLVRFDEHLGMLGSWNRAMHQIPADIPYVKHLGADDRMTPDCLRRMVDAAAGGPEVSMVAAQWREGSIIAPIRPVPRPHRMSGREAMRRYLLGGPDTFGTPSACLFRRDALEGIDALYPAESWPPTDPEGDPGPSTDKIGFADILERGDFVFIPDVLTYDEARDGAQSGFARRMRVQVPGDLDALLIVGRRFLEPAEFAQRVRILASRYSRSLAKAVLLGRPFRERRFASLHHHILMHLDQALAAVGLTTARTRLAPLRAVFAAAHRCWPQRDSAS